MQATLLRGIRRHLGWGTILIILLAGCSLTPVPATRDPLEEYNRVEPDPALSPEEVVKIQMEALKYNDETDKGIEITFRFASPGNKRFTGPLTRFTRMIKNDLYSPMLNHQSARYGTLERTGNYAAQRVTVIDSTGRAVIYVFALSKQDTPSCAGCWMTDGVTVEPVEPGTQNQA